jgi:hypothetical protein
MTIPFFDFISNFKKSRPRPAPERPHSMLVGLSQKIFLNQWGEPETQVGLSQLGRLERLGTLFLITDPTEEAPLNIWIYKKKDSVLFFTKEKLVSHFSSRKFR